jgi:uncharacterized protein with ParB-like and HNH nuclease domain
MQPSEQTLEKLLAGPVQLMIPIFQRPYAWKLKQQQKLWLDIFEQYERNLDPAKAKLPKTHFMGSIVVAPDPKPDFARPRYLLIDGQQRLTTLTLLICALRDVTTDPDSEEEAILNRTYLFNDAKDGGFSLKVRPAMATSSELQAIVERTEPEHESGLSAAYYYLCRAIEDLIKSEGKRWNLESLKSAILRQLTFINITCDPLDDPHQIFESLNATGLALSQSDLIRNLLFMALGYSNRSAESIHSKVWLPAMSWLEEDAKSGPKRTDDLYWADLIRQGNTGLTRENIYSTFETYSASQNRLDEAKVAEKEIRRIAAMSRPYQWICSPESFPGRNQSATRVRRALSGLASWGAQPALPLILELAAGRSAKRIHDGELAESLEVTLSYFVRRALCGVPTNNLNRILFPIAAELGAGVSGKAVLTLLRDQLSDGSAYWPTDADLEGRLPELNFYEFGRGPQRRLVLDGIELQLAGKEPPDLTAPGLSIEHIMPQTLTKDWARMISADAAEAGRVHAELVHRIGNLTLTGYNGELSNKPFERKKQLLRKTTFRLSDELVRSQKWTPEKIRARSKKLSGVASAVWVGPNEGARGIDGRY